MASEVHVKTPLVVSVCSRQADYFTLRADGTVSLSYKLPNGLLLREPHYAKLLFVHGLDEAPLGLVCPFVQTQSVDGNPKGQLGTSLAQSNVYVPVRDNYISATGWLQLARLDGFPIRRLSPVVLAIHLVPASQLPLLG